MIPNTALCSRILRKRKRGEREREREGGRGEREREREREIGGGEWGGMRRR